ncbi:hypothetical protein GUITHDRAFT_102205 [Guillardia theta CCMP2712]|uniref:Vacuolar ATPase assembly integral membrane protein VMA21 homolog n=1 Tax=Guillardia theta (strain CCMP2712) TaxID=905079 RepID=L1JVB0_GUITC|nr:hypothetical protein GUITHDRAFT_102205 [Guillardia theta CCMP2712]EKX52302.1 hypothetical protein GUITHDRAFT_102205 [Guillardia theta CCMP2712]|mmetsp:Transcript_23674/g.77051  ORF Transcript_23674/g.77051 Transcript_23674/m.77051 type:complete len:112 (-) Transcript_23674:3328-3663(-)|eukprot:XP_005839282.1 hypothetical protein GUITHDRAFT_102205 [Guillardia theta CCMP2712]
MSTQTIKDILVRPENRPAFVLLMKSTVAMIVFPVAVYYFCFLFLFNKGGIIDLSDDLNNRVNYSGFAAVAAVQVVIAFHVILAFRQDAYEIEQENRARGNTGAQQGDKKSD